MKLLSPQLLSLNATLTPVMAGSLGAVPCVDACGCAGCVWGLQVEREGDGGEQGLGLREGPAWSDGLGRRLFGSLSSSSLPALLPLPPPFSPPAPWPSRPSEFSSISWMRGGMEPGISIFSVITRSAPVRERGGGV